MKIQKGCLAVLLVGAAVFSVSSCAYDPYYSGGYSGGYGHGYGYGSSNFSTTYFVSTGNPRWGYDPRAGCYYDYTRRCYYDPYLYGYYPAGYRPRYVHGAPHPGGWTYGRSHCPPPSRIRSHTLSNCDRRAESYRSLGRDWSRNVSVNTMPSEHGHGHEGWGRGDSGRHHQDSPGFPGQGGFFPGRAGNDGEGHEGAPGGFFGHRRGGFDADGSEGFPRDRGDGREPQFPQGDDVNAPGSDSVEEKPMPDFHRAPEGGGGFDGGHNPPSHVEPPQAPQGDGGSGFQGGDAPAEGGSEIPNLGEG